MSKIKKILLIGTLPPPISGQTISFKMLSDNLKSSFELDSLNISPNISLNNKFYYFFRSFEFMFLSVVFITKLVFKNYDINYLTISQSRYGFIRDFLFINLSRFFNIKVVAHLKGGNYKNFYYSQNLFIRKLIKTTLNNTTNIIVLGEKLKNMFDFDSNLESKIKIINNCIPFKYNNFKKHKINQKEIKILYLSNLIVTKGYLDILIALKYLKNNGFQFKAYFCGKFLIKESNYKNEEEQKNDFF